MNKIFGNICGFVSEHKEWFTVLGLGIIFYFIFFHNIGNYSLMDVDETRYVAMARDMFNSKNFLTLYLNGDYFFEKPPLYFWGECFSFAIFGKINEFTARFPVALYGMLTAFLVYFAGKKIVSRSYGVISSLILATSLEFIILSKFAILDIVVSTCIGFALIFGFMTYFCQEQNKKYFWWLFYIFSGLAVMAKGIPGFVVPFGTMFFVSIIGKRFKEIFKPQYFLVGFLLFFLITVPWHAVMLHIHNPLFFDEYIIKHHLNRFLSSEDIGRKQPFYFYLLTFLWGFFPWILSAISAGICKIKELCCAAKSEGNDGVIGEVKKFNFDELDNCSKFLLFNAVAFIFIMLFFSASSTKLITYILPIYLPAACLLGFVWKKYIEESICQKAINISVYIFGGICILASTAAVFTKFYLPTELYLDIYSAKWFCIILLFVFGVASIVFAARKTEKSKVGVFVSYVLLIAILSAFGTKLAFNIDYRFGQNDLIRQAIIAKTEKRTLASFGVSRRFSLLYYYGDKVNFQIEKDYKVLGGMLKDMNTRVIVKNKDLKEIRQNVDFVILDMGRKYSLIKGIFYGYNI